jgi:hypothetical protein
MHVVIIHLLVNAAVPVEIVVIHRAFHHGPVDVNPVVVVIDVDIVDMDIRPASGDPTSTLPAVIIDSMPAPIEVVVQPRPDGQTGAKADQGCRDHGATAATIVDEPGIVYRYIDIPWIVGENPYISTLYDHLLLWR